MRQSKYMVIVSPIEKDHPLRGQEIAVYQRAKTGNLVQCPGEAHGNPYIDNCGVCLKTEWGKVEEYAPVDFAAARAIGALDVCDITNGEIDRERREHGAVLLTVNKVLRRKGGMVSSYMILAYPTLRAVVKVTA